jgi:hypothetical protein
VSEFDAKLLMDHAIQGVNAGHTTRHKLLEDHLRSQQQAVSSAVFAALGDSLVKNRGIWDRLGRNRSRQLALVANIDQNDGQRPIAEQASARLLEQYVSAQLVAGIRNHRYRRSGPNLTHRASVSCLRTGDRPPEQAP